MSDKSYPPMPPLSPEYQRLWNRFLKTKGRYETFLRTSDIKNSITSGFRANGVKSGRPHHMMSKLELWFFLILDSCPNVVEIREQYPSDPEITWRISHDFGYEHNHVSDGLAIGSVDFLITVVENGKTHLEACDIKPSEKLSDKRTIEKLDMTRAFYEKEKIPYGIVTENGINLPLAENIKEFRETCNLTEFHIPDIQIAAVREVIEPRLGENKDLTTMGLECDRKLKLEFGTSIRVVQHLVMRGDWFFDLRQKFDTTNQAITQMVTPIYGKENLRNIAA